MPRLPNSLLRAARAVDPLLLPLLGPCRELRAAENELRWLREFVDERVSRTKLSSISKGTAMSREILRPGIKAGSRQRDVSRVSERPRESLEQGLKGRMLRTLVKERGRGAPLQYLLGTEYFGDLEIVCRRGVLIPRCGFFHFAHVFVSCPREIVAF